MKKQILLIIFGLSSFFVNAQGNLQFNQVLTYSGSLTNYASTTDYTVPSGKVWKVEYVESSNAYFFLLINNISRVALKDGNAGNGISPTFWLKANDLMKISASNSGGTYFISIIEYNIVP